ncbi:MAG: molybdenum cofactor guanylyltransferase [Brevibacterium aurantiacum]|uniref:Molybdenum cofactor guanylyltransferase n=1 Tax=Brevibacterium aurantiacum TaxID=273384 RepID=A0A2A3Z612_BREAU|nr:NTP transferase domain-containing protein [Brevibacterium aurantiacum]AZL10656.1 molybdopterin-guanine dinucleotide biosynthesis protein A [Brevibacterium aurantiacum]PCC42720.1 molybdopterin-guanine dinucleotide biosynthesis protein A [Brevibacterium aurantiacum]PCC46943.1 molybdopterin-guanine dinucleotide biosynthesis protein A [Brevibacterium aurantiacum]PCC57392.1 molybdopterin-guanine dinucleotide biosynthesis protein A [Brevibacterium aurantiacum]RCS98300.1 molybdenum cofactor guanyl
MSIRAIILSGGRSNRFGGVHKPAVELGGTTVISRIFGAVCTADPDAEVWVAGPCDGLTAREQESVHSVVEEPAFAGPLAGIAAVCAAFRDASSAASAGVTLALAGDMPLITAGHLGDLIEACQRTGTPATGTDDRGKTQFLCAAWPTELLLSRLDDIGDPTNGAVKWLFSGLELSLVDVEPGVVADFDTAEDLDRIHTRIDEAASTQ